MKPYPYREEDVAYSNEAANNITLAATLTVPAGRGPFPAVLLITGSGAQDRDESLMGHRLFLVLADYLTRSGIAVLRADDRGFGEIWGNVRRSDNRNFATDTEAGIAYLQTRPGIDPRKIGLVGYSEEGIIAPMVASRNPPVAFIVLMAGSGVPGDEIMVAQSVLVAEAAGVSRDQAETNATALHDSLDLVKQEKDDVILVAKLREKLAGKIRRPKLKCRSRLLARRG